MWTVGDERASGRDSAKGALAGWAGGEIWPWEGRGSRVSVNLGRHEHVGCVGVVKGGHLHCAGPQWRATAATGIIDSGRN